MPTLTHQGFQIARGIAPLPDLILLREEAIRLAAKEQSTCIRHICKKSPLFKTLSTSSALLALIPKGLIPVRSILFNKTPEQNWPVAWHQDLTIAVTEEKNAPGYAPWSFKDGSPHVQPPAELLQQMVTIRIHLDDTPESNGALQVIPKTHLLGKLQSGEITQYTCAPSVTCECLAGDILLMSPLILHSSKRSEQPRNRRVIHFEYAPRDALHPHLRWFEKP